jgi:predicted transcriptional regulator
MRAVRDRGRPLAVGDERAESVTVRLLPRQVRRLDELAAERHQTRSAVIRAAVERELSAA